MDGKVEFEIEGGITGEARALGLPAAKRHVDDGVKPGAADAANERLMLRQLLSLKVDGAEVDLETARKRCPVLENKVVDALMAAGGFPVMAPASKMVDALTDETGPFVLRGAGLSEEIAARLVSDHPEHALRLIQVRDMERRAICAVVVRAPEPDEVGLVANAHRNGRGLADALLSLCDACVIWSRDPVKETWEKWPAIPMHIVGGVIAELAGGSAELRFRAGR